MPRIPDEILDCIFYLYPTKQDAERGMKSGGCGFFVSLPSEARPDGLYVYAVTNRHVIETANCQFMRLNMNNGGMGGSIVPWTTWINHPQNDIAVTPIQLDRTEIRFKCVPESLFLTKDTIREQSIGPGEDVYLVGRLTTSSGRQQNTPAARFGNISLMPIEPVYHEALDQVEAFQCELKSIGGFSGSPVFVHIAPAAIRPDGIHIAGATGPWLLGIDWGHTFVKEFLHTNCGKTSKTRFVRRNTGISNVAPAWAIREVLDCPELKAQREKEEAKYSG